MRRYGLVDIPTEAADINAVPITNDGVVSGGIVTWTGTGLVFNVSACNYILNGIYYSSPFTTLTLDTADPTYDRIDVFAVNTSSQAVVIKGTASLNPIEPEGDTATTLGLTNVTIAAASTIPSGATRQLVYDEDASSPTEWNKTIQPSYPNANFSYNTADTSQHNTGIKSLIITSGDGSAIANFDKGSTINIADYTNISFAIRLTSSFGTRNFQLNFYNGATSIGFYRISTVNTVGFNGNLLNTWQTITIPFSSISLSQNKFTYFNFQTSNPSITYYLDTICLNGGINTPTGTTSNSFGYVNGSTGSAASTQATDTLSVVGTGLATTSASGKTLTISVPTPIPSQTGNNGKFLTTNGSIVSWGTPTDTGITSLNGLTGNTQTFATGTSGADFGISSVGTTHTFNIPTASSSNRGLLSSSDWSTFNNKQNALTNPITGTGTLNYISKFTATGSTLGNSQIFDNGTSVGIGTALPSSANLLQVEGIVASNTTKTYASGATFSNNVGSTQASVAYSFAGNATIPNSIVTSAILATSNFVFTGTGTVTQSQSASIRTISNLFSQISFSGTVSGTITHVANTRISAPYSASSATLTITNYYGLIIENSTQFTPITATNRWGIYQEGASDANYFGGDLTFNKLAGTGTRMVVASSTGLLSTQAIPSGGSGTVTSVSVVSANGLSGTVANATTTPAITLSTSITGILKGNGTAISAAVSGTDYSTINIYQNDSFLNSERTADLNEYNLHLNGAGGRQGLSYLYTRRGVVPGLQILYLTADDALTSGTTAQRIFATSNDTLTTYGNEILMFEALLYITGMSGTGGNLTIDIKGAGTATIASILYSTYGLDANAATTAAALGGGVSITSAFTTPVTSATGTQLVLTLRGTMRITSIGIQTIIPTIALTTSVTTAVVKQGSYFIMYPVGIPTLQKIEDL